MKLLVFEGSTWNKFGELKLLDSALYKKTCIILTTMLNGDLTYGLEDTQELKYRLSGLWSKKITEKDRLIYKFDEEYLYIYAIGGNFDI